MIQAILLSSNNLWISADVDIWHTIGVDLSYVIESDDGCGITNQIHCVSLWGTSREKPALQVYEFSIKLTIIYNIEI